MYALKHIEALVEERRDITDELWIVRLRPVERISFVPGQYVTVGLSVEGKIIERPYSVASAPHEEHLEFFLEVVPGGKLTPNLYEAPLGSKVYLRPAAKGRFTFDDHSGNRDHFMAATVTGVAPFVSMVRMLASSASTVAAKIAILQAAGVSGELAYAEELSNLARERDWFRYIPTISRAWLDPRWQGERGRVEDVARKHLDALEFAPQSTTAYLCGNPHMIRNMEGILLRAGFPKEHIRKEVYWPD